jgi:hypothetical protein
LLYFKTIIIIGNLQDEKKIKKYNIKATRIYIYQMFTTGPKLIRTKNINVSIENFKNLNFNSLLYLERNFNYNFVFDILNIIILNIILAYKTTVLTIKIVVIIY